MPVPPPEALGLSLRLELLDEEEAGPWLKNGHFEFGQLIMTVP